MNTLIKKIRVIIGSLFLNIVTICIATLIVTNSTWIYSMIINKCNLVAVTGVSKKALMREYEGLINYLQNPFIDKLNLESFSMSTYGEVHFYEVKQIFVGLIFIVAIFTLMIILISLRKKIQKRQWKSIEIIRYLNYSANVMSGFFISIAICYWIDFSWAFTMFHKIFFRNDYWIFDPRIDPIILALPEELFMILGIAIMVILLLMIVSVKALYHLKGKSKVSTSNSGLEI